MQRGTCGGRACCGENSRSRWWRLVFADVCGYDDYLIITIDRLSLVALYFLRMANTLTIDGSIHARLKRLAQDSGITLKQFVHNTFEDALTAAEKKVADAKKKSTRK